MHAREYPAWGGSVIRADGRVLVPLILVPCIVALLTWFALRGLQGWWLFAGLNDRRPGIVFVAAMIGLVAVVIGEFLAFQRQVAVRALAKSMSLVFAPDLSPSLTMQIKHLVIGKGSQTTAFIENVIQGDYQGMQLVMADLRFVISRGAEQTDRQDLTIWFFTDRVGLFPQFTILPCTGSKAVNNKGGGDVAHFPSFSKLYTIASDEQDVAEQVVNDEFCHYFRSRHNWQIHADGPCIAFVRGGKVAVDEWEMYLREAMGAVKLLSKRVEGLLEQAVPKENVDARDSETECRALSRFDMERKKTESMRCGEGEREAKAVAGGGELAKEQNQDRGNALTRSVDGLLFERKDSVGSFAVVDSLVASFGKKAVRYDEVSVFMQGLPPRTLPQMLRDENVPRVPVVLWFMFLPLIVLGLVTLSWGVLYAVGMTKAGNEWFIVFGIANLLPVVATWGFFHRKRRVFFEIMGDGVCTLAVVESRHSTEDYDIEDWLMCKHKVRVQFYAGAKLVQSEVKVKGMQMKTLQQCLDNDRELFVLYLKNRPLSFLLSVQLASRRFAE
ncbi:MAG: hypothetical protein ACR2N1_06085 [Rubripirellula sp.]